MPQPDETRGSARYQAWIHKNYFSLEQIEDNKKYIFIT